MAGTDYSVLIKQAEALIEGVPHFTANLANVSALVYDTLEEVNWAGFYLSEGDRLILGPFQGKPACIEIPYGRGVCGTAAAEDAVQLVPDVHLFPGHIACDSASRSEIVVPLHRSGKVAGVLDIDSPLPGRFSGDDRAGLERLAAMLDERLFASGKLETGAGVKAAVSVGCVILAGGRSSRMGTDKALLKLDGKTYIERIAGELEGFSERIVSGGDSALADTVGFTHVPDIYPGRGPMGGLYSALRACQSDALFAVACDMPFFEKAVSDYLISQLSEGSAGVVCVSPDGRVQPLCGIYTKACIETFGKHLEAGELRLMPVLKELGIKTVEIPPEIAGEKCFKNVNRPEDIA